MKNLKNWMFALVMIFAATSAFSQNKVVGTVVDGEFQMGLPGATVVLKGTQNGVSTGNNGEFELNVNGDKGTVEVSFIGYQTKTISFAIGANKKADLGKIVLTADEGMLDDIVIIGVADVAKDRKTPVAVSTIKAAEIQEKLGSQEFPELLNTTPSVFASKGGGGFGDSSINIRGFDQKNIAVLINGMPVNDMEGGSVYWSNWAGLSDVTSAMQVQRGLGSSKIAISSVGGTINVLTRTSDVRPGGTLMAGVGNDSYFKGLAAYNTGVLENGLSASVLMGYNRGNGYVEGTGFESTSYFFGLGYRSKDSRHNLQFTFTGASQDHTQRSTMTTIEDMYKYNDGEINKRWNVDYGQYQGKGYNWRSNFYNKPVMSVNWDFNINEMFKLSTVVYGSWGRGGGSGLLGKVNGMGDRDGRLRDANGHVRYDDIARYNSGQAVEGWGTALKPQTAGDYKGQYIADRSNGMVQRASINSHDWYGMVMNLNTKVNSNWTVDLGLDARVYKGYHFQNLINLYGADGYADTSDYNVGNAKDEISRRVVVTDTYAAKSSLNPWVNWNDRTKVGYNNDGDVKWLGGFGQVEYSKDNLTVFAQGSISNQWFQRIDYMKYDRRTEEGQEKYKSGYTSLAGGSIKGGLNYNINENHNVFGNAGYFSRQPFMNNGVYINNSNEMNPNLQNEKILGFELGYGIRYSGFKANVNVYRTSWKDRIIRTTANDVYGSKKNPAMPLVDAYANLYGVEQLHQGVEFDFIAHPVNRLDITGSLSWGDWKYKGNVTADYLNVQNNDPVLADPKDPSKGYMTSTLYLDGVRVGDAPQFIINLGAAYEIVPGLKIDGNYRFNDKYYGLINPQDFSRADNKGAIKLPSFNLFDAGISYKMNVGKDKKNSVSMRVNVNNLFDTTYITASRTNIHNGDTDAKGNVVSSGKDWKGVDTNNEVYFGVGRTWNASIRYNF